MTSALRPGPLAGIVVAALTAATAVRAEEAAATPEAFAVHGQATFVDQANAAFAATYSGQNSLRAAAQGRETFDLTLYAGWRPWSGAELWINPEIDQGFGLSNTLGIAGFSSGEAYKVGQQTPYPKLPRLFLRQTIDLGGEREAVAPDQNQLGGSHSVNRVVLTVGKFSVVDVFDTNAYAHDPRQDFFNWALIDAGSFDYAANAWGYTYGATAEVYRGGWVLRGGLFDLSQVPNDAKLDPTFRQYEAVAEVEAPLSLAGRAGKLKLTAFRNDGRMGRFDDAVRQAALSGGPANIAAVRQTRTRSGVSLNLEQSLSDHAGLFVRAGVADGKIEPYEFADIDRTISAGLSIKGEAWGRADDAFGVAGVLNGISPAHQRFLNAGGVGILVGDGRLPHPGDEAIVETFYDLGALKPLYVTLDYQWVDHPAYNRDRGPVSIGGIRLHAQF